MLTHTRRTQSTAAAAKENTDDDGMQSALQSRHDSCHHGRSVHTTTATPMSLPPATHYDALHSDSDSDGCRADTPPVLSLSAAAASLLRQSHPSVYAHVRVCCAVRRRCAAALRTRDAELQRCVTAGHELLARVSRLTERCASLCDERDRLALQLRSVATTMTTTGTATTARATRASSSSNSSNNKDSEETTVRTSVWLASSLVRHLLCDAQDTLHELTRTTTTAVVPEQLQQSPQPASHELHTSCDDSSSSSSSDEEHGDGDVGTAAVSTARMHRCLLRRLRALSRVSTYVHAHVRASHMTAATTSSASAAAADAAAAATTVLHDESVWRLRVCAGEARERALLLTAALQHTRRVLRDVHDATRTQRDVALAALQRTHTHVTRALARERATNAALRDDVATLRQALQLDKATTATATTTTVDNGGVVDATSAQLREALSHCTAQKEQLEQQLQQCRAASCAPSRARDGDEAMTRTAEDEEVSSLRERLDDAQAELQLCRSQLQRCRAEAAAAAATAATTQCEDEVHDEHAWQTAMRRQLRAWSQLAQALLQQQSSCTSPPQQQQQQQHDDDDDAAVTTMLQGAVLSCVQHAMRTLLGDVHAAVRAQLDVLATAAQHAPSLLHDGDSNANTNDDDNNDECAAAVLLTRALQSHLGALPQRCRDVCVTALHTARQLRKRDSTRSAHDAAAVAAAASSSSALLQLQEEKAQLQASLQQCRARVQELTHELQSSQVACAASERRVREAAATAAAAQTRLQQQQQQQARDGARVVAAAAAAAEAQVRSAAHEATVAQLHQRIAQLTRDVQRAQQQAQSDAATAVQLRDALTRAQTTASQLRSALAEAQRTRQHDADAAAAAATTTLLQQRRQQQHDVNELRARLQRSEEAHTRARDACAAAQQELHALRALNHTLEVRLGVVEGDRDPLRQQLRQLLLQ